MALTHRSIGRVMQPYFGRFSNLRAEYAKWLHADWVTTTKNSARCTTNQSHARADQVPNDYFVHSTLRWQTKVGTDTFFVANTQVLHQRYKLWSETLPNVDLFYAIKSNPDKKMMSVLHSLGCGFDCASQQEMCVWSYAWK